jgi:hypothetical protein
MMAREESGHRPSPVMMAREESGHSPSPVMMAREESGTGPNQIFEFILYIQSSVLGNMVAVVFFLSR